VCLVGLGNTERGDDGFGVHLAHALTRRLSEVEPGLADTGAFAEFPVHANGRRPAVLIADTRPERWVSRLAEAGYDHVIFFDAVNFDGPAGAVAFLDASETEARHPQISTHKISLGLLGSLIEANGRTKVWLLGVQPASLQHGGFLSPAVTATLQVLADLFAELIHPDTVGAAEDQEVPCA
jgi:hydrogenase 3 maturation protease